MHLLGLDIGTKRIGVALRIPPAQSPTALSCLDRAQGRSEQELIKIIEKYKIELIVAGLPLDELNQETEQSKNVQNFCRRLSRRVNIPIEFVDEWGSSMEAERSLKKVKKSPVALRKSGIIDAESAVLILREYLGLI